MKQTDRGVLLFIKVAPKAHQTKLSGWEGDSLKIHLRALPEKGEANKELIHFLSKMFSIPKERILLIKGEKGRHKQVLLLETKIDHIQAILSKSS